MPTEDVLGAGDGVSIDRCTVNSEIFARVLFSRNFAYAEFRVNKSSRNGEVTLSFTDICKSYLSRDFLTAQIVF